MTDRPPLDAVLFDAGGTLVRLDFEWMAAKVSELGHPLEASALRRAEIEGRRAYDASRGKAPQPGEAPPALGSSGDTRAYFSGMLEALAVPAEVHKRALVAFFEHHDQTGLWTRPMEGARAAIDGVRELGLRRAVVSNSDGRAQQHLEECGVLEGVEFVLDSHLIGIEKPDPLIVKLALERFGVAPDRALFVGDIRSVDAAVAQAAGTRFVLVDPFGDYALPGTPAIAGMQLLPAWIALRFTTPRKADVRV